MHRSKIIVFWPCFTTQFFHYSPKVIWCEAIEKLVSFVDFVCSNIPSRPTSSRIQCSRLGCVLAIRNGFVMYKQPNYSGEVIQFLAAPVLCFGFCFFDSSVRILSWISVFFIFEIRGMIALLVVIFFRFAMFVLTSSMFYFSKMTRDATGEVQRRHLSLLASSAYPRARCTSSHLGVFSPPVWG